MTRVVIGFRLGDAVAAPNREGNFIHDDVGAAVVQNQMTANESVLEIRWANRATAVEVSEAWWPTDTSSSTYRSRRHRIPLGHRP